MCLAFARKNADSVIHMLFQFGQCARLILTSDAKGMYVKVQLAGAYNTVGFFSALTPMRHTGHCPTWSPYQYILSWGM